MEQNFWLFCGFLFLLFSLSCSLNSQNPKSNCNPNPNPSLLLQYFPPLIHQGHQRHRHHPIYDLSFATYLYSLHYHFATITSIAFYVPPTPRSYLKSMFINIIIYEEPFPHKNSHLRVCTYQYLYGTILTYKLSMNSSKAFPESKKCQ